MTTHTDNPTGHDLSARMFPALYGDVVTEGHARKCREEGHATHTLDGAGSGVCPRCGDVTGSGYNLTITAIHAEADRLRRLVRVGTYPQSILDSYLASARLRTDWVEPRPLLEVLAEHVAQVKASRA